MGKREGGGGDRHKALGTLHRIGWENNKQTTETMMLALKTIELRSNKVQ